MPLVSIFNTFDVAEALVLKSALEAAGLLVTVSNIEQAHQISPMLPALGGIDVFVSDMDEDAARQILDDRA